MMTDINIVKRTPDRASYDKNKILKILGANRVCHIAIDTNDGPVCIPMFYFVYKDQICIHGSKGSRLINKLKQGAKASVAVTKETGLVLSRSAFHHSMNYQSIVAHGVFSEVPENELESVAREMVDSIARGRSQEVRMPNATEWAMTKFLVMPIDKAACKERFGGPSEDPGDMNVATWAGEIPIETTFGDAVPDQNLLGGFSSQSTSDIIGS